MLWLAAPCGLAQSLNLQIPKDEQLSQPHPLWLEHDNLRVPKAESIDTDDKPLRMCSNRNIPSIKATEKDM